MSDQKTKAGNQGDVVKHACLQEWVKNDPKYESKGEFWYVETHTAYPCYFLPVKGSWEHGVGRLVQNVGAPTPQPLVDYADVAYLDMPSAGGRFPAKRTYLGSSAQVFHLLKQNENRVRMTLFELHLDPARELFEYFQNQGVKALFVAAGSNTTRGDNILRRLWDAAVQSMPQDDLVMIVQGDSYALAPTLWRSPGDSVPDFVLVDPFKIGDSKGQPMGIVSSLSKSRVPFMCWTPLLGVPKRGGTAWTPTRWSFESHGNRTGDKTAQRFVRHCVKRDHHLAWFSWLGADGARQAMYGCQLAFGGAAHHLLCHLIAPPVGGQGLPYLDLGTGSAGSAPSISNFQNPGTYWRTPGAVLDRSQHLRTSAGRQPGFKAWDEYHAAFWWP